MILNCSFHLTSFAGREKVFRCCLGNYCIVYLVLGYCCNWFNAGQLFQFGFWRSDLQTDLWPEILPKEMMVEVSAAAIIAL